MLRFRTFGTVDLRREDGGRLEELLGQPKRLALLAYLADRQHSGPVRREQILTLLWLESAPSDARHALSSTLSRLRHTLGEEVIRGRGEETLWLSAEHFRSDVAAFQEAREAGRPREALDLYRGPFLEGFRPLGARRFEEWVEDRRRAYERRAYEMGLKAGEAAYKRGDLEVAETYFRRAHDINPFKQKTAERLVRLLAEQGERGEALQFYETFRERLANELDLAPSEELRERAAELQSQQDSVPGDISRRSVDSETEVAATGGEAKQVDGRRQGWGVPDGLPRPHTWAAGLLLVLGLVAGGLWVWNTLGLSSDGEGTSPATGGAKEVPTVAVLPFENLGESEETRPFLKGLHSELLTRLSNVDGLTVTSRTAVLPYREMNVDPAALADSLTADWVVEGAVQQVGDRIRVNAQLIDPSTNAQTWAASYERELTAENLFRIQEELTRKIVRALDVELTSEDERQLTSMPTENTTAYELYLQAKAINPDPNTRITEADTEHSIRLYRRALELDSTFAEAWARLADAYVGRAWRRGWDLAWADSGRRSARRALNLDPDLADAHVQLGDAHWVLGNTEQQLKAYRRAWELKPEPGMANNLIVFLERRGRYAEKLNWLDRVVATSPESPEAVRSLVATNVLLGRDSVVEAWRRYAREREISVAEVEFSVALLYHADPNRARALLDSLADRERAVTQKQRRALLAVYERDWKQARRLYRELSPRSAGGLGLTGGLLNDRLGLAWSLKQLGQRTEAEHIAEQVRADAEDALEGKVPGSGVRNRLAVAHLLLGETGRALDWLEKAVEAGERSAPLLESVPTLAPLRDHPRFQSLLDRLRGLLAEERRQAERNGWGEPPE